MEKTSRRRSIPGLVLIILVLAGIGWIYAGFYFPDPYALGRWPLLSMLILWGMRILIPIAVIGILVIVRKARSGRLDAADLLLLAGSTVLTLLVFYPVGNYFHHRSSTIEHRTETYHPYLQIAPNDSVRYLGVARNSYAIVCLGGSTTQFRDSAGRGWPQRVESLLRERYRDRDIAVYNQGRAWYTSLHSLINYETNIRHRRPDLLIVMHAVNDLLQNADFSYFSTGTFREDYGHFPGPVIRLVTHEGLVKHLAGKLGHYWYHEPREEIVQGTFPGEAAFRRNLSTLIDLAREDGTGVVLMTQPTLYRPEVTDSMRAVFYMLDYEAVGPGKRWSYESAFTGLTRYNDIVRDLAGERGVLLIDLERLVPKELEYFTDEVHYADPTFDLIAREIATALVDEGTIEKRGRFE